DMPPPGNHLIEPPRQPAGEHNARRRMDCRSPLLLACWRACSLPRDRHGRPALPTVGITTDAPAPALTHRLEQLVVLVPVSPLAACLGEIDGLILLPDADDHN